jgi:SNF2 family DNA or RNA helicase
METFIDLVSSIKDQGDKVVAFTQYTNLGLFLIADELTKAGISYVTHYGTGMTDKEAQEAQDSFKADPSITVFLSSDAGSHGLSFQEARYVINYDLPYSFDLLTQRNDRIDRADSFLEGLTSYVLITEDTVEMRIWNIVNQRRLMSAAIQGTKEQFSRSSEDENMKELMFG